MILSRQPPGAWQSGCPGEGQWESNEVPRRVADGAPRRQRKPTTGQPPKASRDSGGNPRTLRLPAHRGQAGPLISPGNRPSRRLRDVDLLLHFTVVGEKVANRSWKSGPHVHKSRQRLRFPLPLEIKNRRDAINQEAELRSTSVRLSMPPPAPPRELEGASHNRCGGRPYVEAQFRVVPATEGTRPAPQPLFSIQGVAIAPASAGALKARKNWEEPGKSTAFQVPWTASAQSDAIVFACHFPESIRFALAPAGHRHSSGIVVPLQSLLASPWIFAGGRPFPGSL